MSLFEAGFNLPPGVSPGDTHLNPVEPVKCIRCEGTGNARYERDSPRSPGCPWCGGTGYITPEIPESESECK